MVWTRSDTLALAATSCTACHGLGLITGKRGKVNPCNCVLRAIFRACYRQFQKSVTKEKHMSRVTLSHSPGGRERRFSWGRKDEEYIADFTLMAQRHLDAFEYKIFRYHFLLGADWKLCCRKLRMDRGNFFHAVYRVMHKLGRAFRETEPYGLHPVDEYFATTMGNARATEVAVAPMNRLVPPLRRAA